MATRRSSNRPGHLVAGRFRRLKSTQRRRSIEHDRQRRQEPPYRKPRDAESPGANAIQDIAGALNTLLADVFALYMKTKNFHWHMSAGRIFATIT